MDLSILIINWNSVALLRKCLASVYANVGDMSFEVIVVDNASYDGCAEMLAREFPLVRFVQSDENLGFARGNNLAARYATARYVLFLNSDTEVLGTALQQLLACMAAKPDAGALGPKLLNSDGSIQTTCLQAFPSIFNHFVDSAFLRRQFPRLSVWGNRALFEDSVAPVTVDGIVGACMMVRRDLFEELGGFHGDYFMYAEDMDLCYRLQKRGLTNYYVGTAQVVHHGGQSSSQQSDRQFTTIVMRESLTKFMRIHKGPAYAALFKLSTAAAAVVRLTFLGIGMLMPIASDQKRRLKIAASKWRRVFRWAVGIDVRTQ